MTEFFMNVDKYNSLSNNRNYRWYEQLICFNILYVYLLEKAGLFSNLVLMC